MPCISNYDEPPQYGGGNRETSSVYLGSSILEIEELKRENKKLEAGLCAIISELEKRDIANEVLPEASRRGLIDLMGFWYEHRQLDEVRLATEMHKYSVHEQEVLRKILNENKPE